MKVEYKVEYEMNGSYGVLSKSYDDLESAKMIYLKKCNENINKNIKLIKSEVVEFKK